MTAELIEPTPVTDIYADDIATVELVGPNVRLTYFTWQGGYRVIVCRLIRPAESVDGRVLQLLADAVDVSIKDHAGRH